MALAEIAAARPVASSVVVASPTEKVGAGGNSGGSTVVGGATTAGAKPKNDAVVAKTAGAAGAETTRPGSGGHGGAGGATTTNAAASSDDSDVETVDGESDAAVVRMDGASGAGGGPGGAGFGASSAGPAGVSFDDDGPMWPDAAAESAFLGEARDSGGTVSVGSASARGEGAVASDGGESAADKTPLPSLDSLVARLSAETRETLEDLFRARFTEVKRVSKMTLKEEHTTP